MVFGKSSTQGKFKKCPKFKLSCWITKLKSMIILMILTSLKLVVHPLKDGVYPCTLWSRRTGDLCGHGNLTPDELHDWLAHYGLEEK